MKKIILFFLAAAGIVTYLLGRKKTPAKSLPVEHTHHLTQVFSRAKHRAVNA
jgi:hypothetical protein